MDRGNYCAGAAPPPGDLKALNSNTRFTYPIALTPTSDRFPSPI